MAARVIYNHPSPHNHRISIAEKMTGNSCEFRMLNNITALTGVSKSIVVAPGPKSAGPAIITQRTDI